MARPTTIRSKTIGHKYLGTVVTITNPFKAWFQLYLIPVGKPHGHFLAIREDEFDTEEEAVAMFDAWGLETELLVAAGDM